jgi:hypothetical protein
VEFVLILPVLLLLALVAIDFGRALYGWVILQNSARIAANYAGIYPSGWRDGDPTIQAEYEILLERDLSTANCDAPDTPPPPTFTDGPDTFVPGGNPDTVYDVGDVVRVDLTCTFSPVTPIISAVFGPTLELGAGSEFRIRAGEITGFAFPTQIPPPMTPQPTATPPPVTHQLRPRAAQIQSPTSRAPQRHRRLAASRSATRRRPPRLCLASWSWDLETARRQPVEPVHLHKEQRPAAAVRRRLAARSRCLTDSE